MHAIVVRWIESLANSCILGEENSVWVIMSSHKFDEISRWSSFHISPALRCIAHNRNDRTKNRNLRRGVK
jgi:hypothetical protein